MRVFGIDPGFGRCGYAVLEGLPGAVKLVTAGVIETSPRDDFPARLGEIAEDISSLITQFSPDVSVIEKLFFQQNITTGIPVAEARGVIQLTLFQGGLRVLEVAPNEAKAAFTGDGHADKMQMKNMVKMVFPGEGDLIDDAADAIAVAWWGVHHLRGSALL